LSLLVGCRISLSISLLSACLYFFACPCFFLSFFFSFFFFNDTATTEIYTLSLHDALPISRVGRAGRVLRLSVQRAVPAGPPDGGDRKSTRLNSSHGSISYAVFCLKKKKINKIKKQRRYQMQTMT